MQTVYQPLLLQGTGTARPNLHQVIGQKTSFFLFVMLEKTLKNFIFQALFF